MSGSVVDGGIVQVRGVSGSVRIGSPGPRRSGRRPTSPAASRPGPADVADGDQRIDGTWSNGPAHRIGDVGGDVKIG
ncbi:hypothetical protein [Actinoplanes sp. NPDC026619]|uniref:hypothetical protein n=1 Tax=Actinoplanes sp. NPDC026619 TaxID=3155798 RepID=UPI00340ADF6B